MSSGKAADPSSRGDTSSHDNPSSLGLSPVSSQMLPVFLARNSSKFYLFSSLVMPIFLIIFSVVHQKQNTEKDKQHSLNINDCYTAA